MVYEELEVVFGILVSNMMYPAFYY